MPPRTTQPEILRPGQPPISASGVRPRLGGGGGAFRDENLDLLSRVLDTWFRVPGTNIRFGLDGIIGFVPGVGDLLGGLASCIIVLAAYFRGVPLITIARMVANLAIEVVVGLIPVLGNLFDIGWRANRRNYKLLEGSIADPRRHTLASWLVFAALAIVLVSIMLLPALLLAWLWTELHQPPRP